MALMGRATHVLTMAIDVWLDAAMVCDSLKLVVVWIGNGLNSILMELSAIANQTLWWNNFLGSCTHLRHTMEVGCTREEAQLCINAYHGVAYDWGELQGSRTGTCGWITSFKE